MQELGDTLYNVRHRIFDCNYTIAHLREIPALLTSYWKCNFPMSPPVRRSVGWLVGQSVMFSYNEISNMA